MTYLIGNLGHSDPITFSVVTSSCGYASRSTTVVTSSGGYSSRCTTSPHCESWREHVCTMKIQFV